MTKINFDLITQAPRYVLLPSPLNGVGNGAISITQWGFISGCYKVKSIGQWVKNFVMAMGFVDQLGQGQ